MITCMKWCVAHHDLWPCPISWSSFNYDFAKKNLLKHGTSVCVRSTACTLLDGLFAYWVQMITGIRGCVTHNDLWPWPISFRSFCYDFAIKLLRSHILPPTTYTVLYGCFASVAQMITSIRGSVACNYLSPWPLSPRSISHDFVIKLLK